MAATLNQVRSLDRHGSPRGGGGDGKYDWLGEYPGYGRYPTLAIGDPRHLTSRLLVVADGGGGDASGSIGTGATSGCGTDGTDTEEIPRVVDPTPRQFTTKRNIGNSTPAATPPPQQLNACKHRPPINGSDLCVQNALDTEGILTRHDFHGEWNYTLHPEPRHAEGQ